MEGPYYTVMNLKNSDNQVLETMQESELDCEQEVNTLRRECSKHCLFYKLQEAKKNKELCPALHK